MRELSQLEQQILVKYVEVQDHLNSLVAFTINELSDEWQQETLDCLERIKDLLEE